MSVKNKKDLLNIFDLAVLLIVILFALAVTFKYTLPNKASTDRKVLVTITVTSDTTSIKQLAKSQQQVYLNSSNTPVDVVLVDDSQGLRITVSALGKIDDGAYFANGQRILIGQKAEIHSTYFAQGTITSVSYAN